MGDDDSTESHYEDTFAAGHRAARPELVRQLADGGPGRDRLARLRSASASPATRAACACCAAAGASRKRLLQAGERTGAEMVKALRAAVRASGAEVWESTPPGRPRARGRRLAGRRRAGRQRHRGAPSTPRAVVLAAGGGLRGEAEALGLRSTNHPDATPEVLRLALELGRRGPRAGLVAAAPDRLGLAGGPGRLRPARDHARLRRHPPRRRRRALRRRARPARRGGPGDHRRRRGRGAAPRRPDGSVGRLARHPRDRPRERRRLHRRAPRLRPQPLPEGRRGHHRASACWSTPCSTTATEVSRSTSNAATTLPGVFAAGEIAGGRPRVEPPDGQLPARHRRLRAPRRPAAPRRSPDERRVETLGPDARAPAGRRLPLAARPPAQAAPGGHHARHRQGPAAARGGGRCSTRSPTTSTSSSSAGARPTSRATCARSSRLYESAGIPVVLGGTFWEVCFVQQKLDEWRRWVERARPRATSRSRTARSRSPHDVKLEHISRAGAGLRRAQRGRLQGHADRHRAVPLGRADRRRAARGRLEGHHRGPRDRHRRHLPPRRRGPHGPDRRDRPRTSTRTACSSRLPRSPSRSGSSASSART